jgi:putative transposase
MYWQKRFDRENPDKELEEKILEIHEDNKDYGYRRMRGELNNQGIHVNKKKGSKNYAKTWSPGDLIYT